MQFGEETNELGALLGAVKVVHHISTARRTLAQTMGTVLNISSNCLAQCRGTSGRYYCSALRGTHNIGDHSLDAQNDRPPSDHIIEDLVWICRGEERYWLKRRHAEVRGGEHLGHVLFWLRWHENHVRYRPIFDLTLQVSAIATVAHQYKNHEIGRA